MRRGCERQSRCRTASDWFIRALKGRLGQCARPEGRKDQRQHADPKLLLLIRGDDAVLVLEPGIGEALEQLGCAMASRSVGLGHGEQCVAVAECRLERRLLLGRRGGDDAVDE